MTELIGRRLEAVARTRMAEAPVVLLQGPRSVGKSTLLRLLAGAYGQPVVDLDDPAVRAAATDDPALFASAPPPVLIDEYQHAPELLAAIKAELNRDGSPGRFVLTGSVRFDSLPLVAESLTGRLHRLEIHPLSQGEIDSRRENLIETLLRDPHEAISPEASTTTRAGYVERITRGGFPMALARSGAARDRWFDDYLALCLERDLIDPGRTRRPAELGPLMSRLAMRTAQVLNVSAAGADVGLPASTATALVDLLEAAFLVRRLPAWGKTLRAATASRPKVHVVDSALAARLLRLPPERLAAPEPTVLAQLGHLLESFVVGEILKQASWMEYPPHVGNWRTHDGAEVDVIIEDGRDGSVVGVEVKAGSRVHPRDRRGLRRLRDLLGERFRGGVVFHTGAHCIRYNDERIVALPVDRLWAET
ncbi:MAG: ATP-binding protein [bacterium]|nr:ATP-binding protein [bacterium]MDE0667611.1 ATP-binding protein [bacterium]